MTRYRKKPIEVEAWQVGTEPVPDWIVGETPNETGDHMQLHMDDGSMLYTMMGNWIILHNDRFHVAPDWAFREAYEAVE